MNTALSTQQQFLQINNGLAAYLQAVNKIPMLSAQEEYQLAQRLRDHEDMDAARTLVLSHLRFVARIAKNYAGYGLALADLIQEGNIGLMKAVKRFDPEMKVRLVSFAVHWIRAEMHEFIIRNWRIVKIATTKAQRKLFFNLRGAKKRLGWMNQEEVADVAKTLGVSPAAVLEMETRLSSHDVSFDHPVDDHEDTVAVPAAYLEDLRHDPAEVLEREDWEQDHHQRLGLALEKLDPRSRDIIAKRWLQENKATLHELAAEYQVSAERIRQLESSALNKIKTSI